MAAASFSSIPEYTVRYGLSEDQSIKPTKPANINAAAINKIARRFFINTC